MPMLTEDRRKLTHDIHSCQSCPRLRRHCLAIAKAKRKSFQGDVYWGKPVAPFGADRAELLILGLAPAAHGANRTGRMFTGDRSGDWLYRALYRAGFANQSESRTAGDGLQLLNSVVSCAVKCAPPENKPTPEELNRCTRTFLTRELEHFQQARVFVALGGIAWNTLWKQLEQPSPRVAFKHGAVVPLLGRAQGKYLIGSYHPSQQNTFTGRLTEPMFDSIFAEAKRLLLRTQTAY